MSDSKKEKLLTVRGVVTEALPSTLFRVNIEGQEGDKKGEKGEKGENGEKSKEILAYLSGKMRMHRIKVLIGDTVEIVPDPYGGKGRIVKRL